MQRYKETFDLSKICSISGYAWLFLVINQDEVGTRLALSKNYVKHIPMFRDFLELQRHSYKMTYIYQKLADKYKMHHDSVKRVICMMLRTVEL
jgi:hypothetical protein